MAEEQRWNSEGRRRGPGRPFQPGQSGNPNGRPAKGTSIAECIRSLAGEDGAPYVERLHAIALGENVRNAITAMDVLLDRGYGKVRVDLEIGTRGDPRTMSDAELEAELLKFAEKVGRRPAAEE